MYHYDNLFELEVKSYFKTELEVKSYFKTLKYVNMHECYLKAEHHTHQMAVV